MDKNHLHHWEPAAWDSRYEKCRGCPAARYTPEEAAKRTEAALAAADKRRADYETPRQR